MSKIISKLLLMQEPTNVVLIVLGGVHNMHATFFKQKEIETVVTLDEADL